MRRLIAGGGMAVVTSMACGACGTSYREAPVTADADAGERDAAADTSTPVACGSGCAGAGGTCSAYSFGSGCDGWMLVGNATTVQDCSAGKLHVAADSTLDVSGSVTLATPGQVGSIHITARIVVNRWDGGSVLGVTIDGTRVAELRARTQNSGDPTFSLCSPTISCAAPTFGAKAGAEHIFELDLTAAEISLSVDCKPIAVQPAAIALMRSVPVVLTFGKADAAPIDGTLDDVAVAFR